MNRNFLLAITLLLGTMIGAGIFGVPYVISRSGMIPGFFYFLILGTAVLLIHLFFGEIVLRTKEKHRLPGYAQIYLGNKGKILATFSTLIGTILVLLAYIILGGKFLNILFATSLNLSSFQFSLIFTLALSFFIFRGIKSVARAEFFTNLTFVFIIILIFCLSLPEFSPQNFVLSSAKLDLGDIFLPYGVILFALIGWNAVPEMGEILKDKRERAVFKKAIIFSMIIAILLYCLFTLAVIGVSGAKTSADTFSGLLPYLDTKIIFLGVLAGVITIADSFLIMGLYLKNTLIYDYKLQILPAFLIAWGAPLILFLLGFRQFIYIISLTGTLVGAVEGILLILIFKKAKILGNREPEYNLKVPIFLLYTLIAILILGTIFHFLFS